MLTRLGGALTVTNDFITSNARSWWSADSGVTVSNGRVTQWTDKNIASNLAPIGSTGPSYLANSINGLPGVQFVSSTGTGLRTPSLDLNVQPFSLVTVFRYDAAPQVSQSIIASQAVERSFSNALTLDGINDFVNVTNSSGLNFSGNSPFTFEAWVNAVGGPTNGNGEQNILNKGPDPNCSFRWGFYTNATGKLYLWNNGPNSNFVNADNIMTNNWNKWTHLAASYNGTIVRMYVNGIERFSGTWSGTNDNTFEMTIGCDSQGRFVNGQIADVRIWSVSRTTAQIADNMNRIIDPGSTGLLANYLFADTTQAVNSSTAANKLNNGTYVNGASSTAVVSAASSIVVNTSNQLGIEYFRGFTYISSPSLTLGSSYVSVATWTNNRYKQWINNTLYTDVTYTSDSVAGLNYLTVGTDANSLSRSSVTVCEVMVFNNRSITDAERLFITSILNSKYSIF